MTSAGEAKLECHDRYGIHDARCVVHIYMRERNRPYIFLVGGTSTTVVLSLLIAVLATVDLWMELALPVTIILSISLTPYVTEKGRVHTC